MVYIQIVENCNFDTMNIHHLCVWNVIESSVWRRRPKFIDCLCVWVCALYLVRKITFRFVSFFAVVACNCSQQAKQFNQQQYTITLNDIICFVYYYDSYAIDMACDRLKKLHRSYNDVVLSSFLEHRCFRQKRFHLKNRNLSTIPLKMLQKKIELHLLSIHSVLRKLTSQLHLVQQTLASNQWSKCIGPFAITIMIGVTILKVICCVCVCACFRVNLELP